MTVTYVECAVAIDVVLVIGVIVDGNLGISLAIQELTDKRSSLFKVSLAINRRVVCAGKSSRELASVRVMVAPGTWPAGAGGEII